MYSFCALSLPSWPRRRQNTVGRGFVTLHILASFNLWRFTSFHYMDSVIATVKCDQGKAHGSVSFNSFNAIYFISNESLMGIPISSQVDKKHACVIMMNHSWLTLFLIRWRMTSPCQRNPTLSEMILIKDRAAKEQAPQRHYLRSPSFLTATKIRSLLWHPAHEEPSLEIILSLCLHNYCFLCDESYASCEALNYECGELQEQN